MADLLFLAHRIPYPPDKGDKIRSWHILRHLAERYRVHLGCFVDDPNDWQHVDLVRDLCGDCRFEPLGKVVSGVRGAAALLSGAPITTAAYRSSGFAAWVKRVIAERAPEAAFVYSAAVGQYVLDADLPCRIIDLVDVDSDKWRQYAGKKPWPMSQVYAREGRKLLAFEKRVAEAFDASLLVSPAEADLFRGLAPSCAQKVFHMNNGVDTDYFSPEQRFDSPFGAEDKTLVFTGAMDYWANVDAVSWFVKEVFPLVRCRVLGARFCIVGSNPSAEVRRLAGHPAVEVIGRVPDVRPFIAHAALAVAPLRIARGVQNKVLEAMAMGKAVVTTPQGLEGIDAVPGRDLICADGPEEFASSIGALLSGDMGAAMGARARARMLESYRWAASLGRLDELIGGAPTEQRWRA